MKITGHAISETGPVRTENQDAVAALPERSLFLVADGMGGHAGGRTASRIVKDWLTVPSNPECDFEERIIEASRRVFEQAKSTPELKGMGSTVVVLHLLGPESMLLHVGDSRAYRLRGSDLKMLTRDHSFVGELLAQGQITHEDARVHPYRHMLTRAVGIDPDVVPERRIIDVAPDDIYLLCTDGVSGALSDEEIQHNLGDARKNPATACRALVDAALAAGSRDNASAIVIHVEGL